ncbi:EF-hand domain-containing protein [Saccharopolyspora sp. ID03-671]|uniref:EF-hand domain-containing protein n=1 Tax=Saccharopolyspora sp. ID03-671 TaxID=3073066 RepID=UPI0032453245
MRSVVRGRIKTRFDRWDRDGRGGLRRDDFEREALRIAAAFDAPPEAPESVRLREALRGLFELCADHAGVSPDAAISEVQFLKISEDLIFEQGEAAFNRALRPVAAGVIGVCDGDGDGRIDRAEFVRWLTALGLDDTQAGAAFEHVVGGAGTLCLDELLATIRDYHYGRLDVELIAG